MKTLRTQLPINYLGDKNYLNEILYGAKNALCDIEPRLTSEQNGEIIEIIEQVMVEVKNAMLELSSIDGEK